MSRARIGALGLIAALSPALAFATGCDAVSDVKKGVDQASNRVEVCNASIKLYNEKTTKVQAEIAKLGASAPGDAAKAQAAVAALVKTEFGAIHTGLQEQIGKLENNPEIKTALTAMDTQVAALAAKPELLATDPKATDKLNETRTAVNTACQATEEPKK